MKEIKKHQIKYIHTLKYKAGLKDEEYRALLKSKFNKKSSKDLSYNQAEILIKIFERLINNYATEKQINKFNTLYSKVYYEKDKKEFIEQYLGKDKTVDNITVKECSKLIYILEEIVDWQEKRKLNYSKINKGEE
ncbi:phage protein GemA/Gp16 family protein [Fusobacterium nucleatum]|uniref:phage protein GemA/Gp16 family protein n=1 Tax=Fusobacterium nucleatum TaxID=851 RepID=UPI0030D2DD80